MSVPASLDFAFACNCKGRQWKAEIEMCQPEYKDANR